MSKTAALSNVRSAERNIQGIEMMDMVRKGQVRWLSKSDIAGQISFVEGSFEIALLFNPAGPVAQASRSPCGDVWCMPLTPGFPS